VNNENRHYEFSPNEFFLNEILPNTFSQIVKLLATNPAGLTFQALPYRAHP